MWPRTIAPSRNGLSSLARNQAPNSSASVSARHTRERGARSTICFSMRSVVLMIGQPPGCLNSVAGFGMQPIGCPGGLLKVRSDSGELCMPTLTDLDELLAHQIPEPLSNVATPHEHWRESYFFVAHPRSGP